MKLKKITGIGCLFTFITILAVSHTPHVAKPQHYVVEQHVDSEQPITVYSHGYMGNKWHANIFHRTVKYPNKLNPSAFILGPLVSFNYADWVNPLLTSLGQGDDIERLYQACKDYKQVVLVGTSRGASTIINYLGTYKPTNIIGVVLESPFDHMDNVAQFVLSNVRIKNIQKTQSAIQSMFFRNFDPNGIHPIKVAHEIPKEIPILLICSKADSLIPHSSTTNIYHALRQAGHEKSHLLTCDYGAHGLIMWNKDGKTMRNVIHAFYQKYSIPNYHEVWAQYGLERFAACQP